MVTKYVLNREEVEDAIRVWLKNVRNVSITEDEVTDVSGNYDELTLTVGEED